MSVGVSIPPSIVKQLDGNRKIAWSPLSSYNSYICSGTAAGSYFDDFSDTKGKLELYDLDIGNASYDLRLISSLTTRDVFRSIAWGHKATSDSRGGFIAGGMSNSTLKIWNVSTILKYVQTTSKTQIDRQTLGLECTHQSNGSELTSLEFNPVQPNLLASGGTDGKVIIWDLADIKNPLGVPPIPQSQQSLQQQQQPIRIVAWNRNQRQSSIIAAANELAETTIYDLRRKKTIRTINSAMGAISSIRGHPTALAWNPLKFYELATAYSKSNIVEIWDLRKDVQPRRLEGFHTTNVEGITWCPHDTNLIVTSGSDSRMAGWNASTGQFLTEYQTTGGTQSELAWSPHQYNLVSSLSTDGKINFNSINHAGSHVLKWFHRTNGAEFAFGGRLVAFAQPQTQQQTQSVPNTSRTGDQTQSQQNPLAKSLVTIQQIRTDPQVIELAQSFARVIEQQDFVNFCTTKIEQAKLHKNEEDETTWTFIRILFAESQEQTTLLLKQLGFQPTQQQSSPPQQQQSDTHNTNGFHTNSDTFNESGDDDFFDQDSKTTPQTTNTITPAKPTNDLKPTTTTNDLKTRLQAYYPTLSENDEDESIIHRALLFGDFSTAVERCIETNRLADALVYSSFAFSTHPHLWGHAKSTYFDSHPHPFNRNVMKCASNRSFQQLVETSELTQWKETLAILITYTHQDECRHLVNGLAYRLETSQQRLPAIICYICAGNIDRLLELWSNSTDKHTQATSKTIILHSVIEKATTFSHASKLHLQPASPALAAKYSEYANMLSSQGFLSIAWNYLRVADPQYQDFNSAVLRDQIFHSAFGTTNQIQEQPPPFPFPVELLDVDPNLQNIQQQYELHKQQKQSVIQPTQQQQLYQQTTNQQTFAPQTNINQTQTQRNSFTGQPTQQLQQPTFNQYQQPVQSNTQPQYGQQPFRPPPQQQHAQPTFQGQTTHNPQYPPTFQQPQPLPQQQQQPPRQFIGANPYQTAQTQQQPPPQQFQPLQQHAQPPHQLPPTNAPYNPLQPLPPQQFTPTQPPPQQFQPTHQTPYGQSNLAQPQFPGHPQHQQQPTLNATVPHQQQFNQPPPQLQPSFQQQQQPVPHHTQQPPTYPPNQIPQPNSFTPPSHPAQNPVNPPQIFTPQTQTPFNPAGPTQHQPTQPTPVAAPPAVLSDEHKQQISVLESVVARLESKGLSGTDTKKVNDAKSRLQILSQKLSQNELSSNAITELALLTAKCSANDFNGALQHHLNIVRTDFTNNTEWLPGLRILLQTAKTQLS